MVVAEVIVATKIIYQCLSEGCGFIFINDFAKAEKHEQVSGHRMKRTEGASSEEENKIA